MVSQGSYVQTVTEALCKLLATAIKHGIESVARLVTCVAEYSSSLVELVAK